MAIMLGYQVKSRGRHRLYTKSHFCVASLRGFGVV
jgi:hypothetical protein